MENQNCEKDRLIFLDQFKNLFQKKMYADALALAEERLKVFPMDADAHVAAGEALIAMNFVDKSRDMLYDVETKILSLSLIFARLGELYAKKGYAEEAQFCYQKFTAFNPSSEHNQEVVRWKTIVEEAQQPKSKTSHQDNISSSDHLINTLSGWLENIHRIKTQAANDE